MAYYKDVREYLNVLEAAGKLIRIKQPINKDTEMHPLVRLQYRGLAEADRRSSVLCIDATRPGAYKPTSLPKRELMENALQLWNRLELPPLKIKAPWYGYELGYWSDRNREEAERALHGKH